MEIRGSFQFNYENVKAYARFLSSKRADPKRLFVLAMVINGIVLSQIILQMVFDGFSYGMLFFAIGFGLGIGFECYSYFFSPRNLYNRLGQYKDSVKTYIFTDDSVQISNESHNDNTTKTLAYSDLTRCYESSKFLILFQGRYRVVLVDKSTLEGGTVEELRSKLTEFLGKKYLFCRY